MTRTLRPLLRRHRLLALLVAAGVVLRVLCLLAWTPAMLFIDSWQYVVNRIELDPSMQDPIGYSMALKVLVPTVGLQGVVVLQHLAGLATALAVYAVVLRRGGRPWLAALATAPLLLDGYQLVLEQYVMSDVLFELLLVGAAVALSWRRRPGVVGAAVAGVLVGCSVVVRSVGELVVVPLAIAVLLVAGRAWRRGFVTALALVVGAALPLGVYASYTHAKTGHYAVASSGAQSLYARVAHVVDCDRLELPASERPLCPREPAGSRHPIDWYANNPASPWKSLQPADGKTVQQLMRDFSKRAIRDQPRAVAADYLHDATKALRWTRWATRADVPTYYWEFQTHYPVWAPQDPVAQLATLDEHPRVYPRVARVLRAYELNGGTTPGPVVGLAAVLALAGAVLRRRSTAARTALLWLVPGLAVTLGADVFEFSWRYQVPALLLVVPAGAMGLAALLGPRAPRLAPFPDDVDDAALRAFALRHGEPRLGPVVVVIAAYDEEGSIASTLDGLPRHLDGTRVDVVVVVDGATDGTAAAAEGHDAYVVDVPVNRGQGAALRLGYRLAAAHGAQVVATTDADGQYDPGDLAAVVGPVLRGEADFVSGSRALGRNEGATAVRRLGTPFFARLVSLLARHRVTDTSFGLRAMRAEVATAVQLTQPQYQSSELLLEVLRRGYRAQEVPATMRARGSGSSKKGRDAVYATRYLRVVLGTWWRLRGARASRPAAVPPPVGVENT